MMFKRLLAIGLVLGSLLVLGPQQTTGYTVKLLGNDNSFGEKHIEDLNEESQAPTGDDVFPDPDGDSITNVAVSDELSLEHLSAAKPMTNDEIDAYLKKFGYLATPANSSASHDERKSAVKEFQRFSRLDETGTVDLYTRKQMQRSRCGLADPVSNSKFANFDAKGTRKWKKTDLTYKIVEYTKKLSNAIVRQWTAKAFKMWSDVSQLTFTEVESDSADLILKFTPTDHDDGFPFDGPGGVLAHAFYPQSGKIHLEEAENWTVETKKGTNLLFVLVHEIGHSLGLGHSDIDNAIMEPYYNGYKPNLALSKDDIAGIQFLYGKATAEPPKPPTEAPTPKAPVTKAPTTKAPTTKAPTTQAPTTKAPTTKAPVTKAPTTKAPVTTAPPTKAPVTTAPPTKAPVTRGPTTKVPTTQQPGTTEPTPPARKFPCPFRFWAAMTDGNKTYGFFRRNRYEILPNGRIIRRRSIKAIYRRGPRYVGAAAFNEVSGHTFFFLGRKVWRFTNNKLDEGFPKKLKIYVRAAVVVDEQLIAFSFTHVHYLDEDTMEDYVDGEVTIDEEYPGISPFMRSAVSYGDGLAYILYTKKSVRMDMYTGEIIDETTCYRRRN